MEMNESSCLIQYSYNYAHRKLTHIFFFRCCSEILTLKINLEAYPWLQTWLQNQPKEYCFSVDLMG